MITLSSADSWLTFSIFLIKYPGFYLMSQPYLCICFGIKGCPTVQPIKLSGSHRQCSSTALC